jgi:ribose transport system permease protein
VIAEGRLSTLRHDESLRRIGPYALLAILSLVAGIISPSFLDPENLANIGRQAAPLAFLALGQTVVILAGGLDVSQGAVVSLTTVVAASVMASNDALIVPTVALVISIALVTGLINGVLTSVVRADPFVSTLSTMLILIGAVLVYSQGSPRSGVTEAFRWISQGNVVGLPTNVVFTAIALLAVSFALRRTVWGRDVYAVGANTSAARLSGRPTVLVGMSTYVISSLFAAIGGLLLLARTGSADVTAGSGWELDSIAAVLLGGTVLGGGKGRALGTVAGLLILTILLNLVSLLGLENYVRLIVRGAVIIAGVAIYSRPSSAIG